MTPPGSAVDDAESDLLIEESGDARIMEIVRGYQAELEAGRRPRRSEWLARFPDLAARLAAYFDSLDLVHRAAANIKGESSARPLQSLGPIPESLTINPLGDFRIVREIGRGGMGVVYEAVQLSLGRRVALKVLPFASGFDGGHLQRFKNEAHAAAQLHHSHIVPVYAVGCERGVHYYAMQLIDGQPLSVLLRQMRRESPDANPSPESAASHEANQLTGSYGNAPPAALEPTAENRVAATATASTLRSPSEREYYRTVARLVVQAAEALDHAHQMGVIHRDIKPANLLLDARGQLWVTDFGLAQLQAEAGLTQTGDLVGTMRYMSPEQAGGNRVLLDQRTDIYSLGATLFELLTLTPLFDGRNRPALLNRILNEEPRAPRSLRPSIPLELDTIVLKATNKNPSERYASARELADDLNRFLNDQPILARRATLWDHTRKWARRHPSIIAAGMLILALIIVGLVINNWMIAREQDNTRRAYDQEKQRAAEAERRFDQARAVVDLLLQVSEEELADKPHMQGLRKRLLEVVLVYYQGFISERPDDAAQPEWSAAQARVRKILDELSLLQGAGQIYLLYEPTVLDDLKLEDEKRVAIREALKRAEGQRFDMFKEFAKLSSEERKERFVQLARESEAAISQILTKPQLARLRQIELQIQGIHSLTEPTVAEQLKLKKPQRDRIRGLQADAMFAMFDGSPGGERPPKRPTTPSWRKSLELGLAELDDGQRETWKQLTGDAFQGDVNFMRFGPMGPPNRKPPGS